MEKDKNDELKKTMTDCSDLINEKLKKATIDCSDLIGTYELEEIPELLRQIQIRIDEAKKLEEKSEEKSEETLCTFCGNKAFYETRTNNQYLCYSNDCKLAYVDEILIPIEEDEY